MSLVVMATGGTGGHIYPAVATAHALQERGHQVLMLGQQGGMEERVSAEQHLPFFGVDAGKLARSGQGMADPRELLRAGRGVAQARAVLGRLKPAAVVGYGGFASLPGILAAQTLGIPTVLHEQNALLGLTQKMAVGRARAVGTAYSEVRGLPAGKGELVGMPVREGRMSRAEALQKLGLQDGPLTILIMGGSQGSLFLNQTVPGILHEQFTPFAVPQPPISQPPISPPPIPRTLALDLNFADLADPAPAHPGAAYPGSPLLPNPVLANPVLANPVPQGVQVLHSTGPRWLADVQAQVGDWPWYHAAGYVDAVAAWSVADLAITRAGTSTLAEAAFHGVPLIMVPLPESSENHQYFNGLDVEKAGAGRVVEQKNVPQQLGQAVLECAVPGARTQMREAAFQRAQPGAAARFADLIERHLR